MHFIAKCEEGKDPLLEHINVNIPNLYTNADHISILEAIGAKSINIVVTFTWSFFDCFIIVIGVALTAQFKLFNNDLKQAKHEVKLLLTIVAFQ